MANNAENNQDITVEEFLARLKVLKSKQEDELDRAQEKLDEIEAKEPDCDGAKYERWQEKYDTQQLLIESLTENLEKIDSYLEQYDTDKV